MSKEKPHKRYLVFEYDMYYPRGGMNDLFGSYDTLIETLKAIEKDKNSLGSDFYTVYDRRTGREVNF